MLTDGQEVGLKKRPSMMIRVLGILVGLLSIGMAPIILNDAGLAPLDRLGRFLVPVTLGLIFIGYGLTGLSEFPKIQTIAGRMLVVVASAIFFLGAGLYLVLTRQGSTISQIIGALFLFHGATAIWAAYAIYKSRSAA